jgi:mono/diheme cytochrome c family protein
MARAGRTYGALGAAGAIIALAAGCGGRADNAADASPAPAVDGAEPAATSDDARSPAFPLEGSVAPPGNTDDDFGFAAGPLSPTDAPGGAQRDCQPPPDDVIDTMLGAANLGSFSVHCVRCHDPARVDDGVAAEPIFRGLGDAVARGLLDPCNPDDSPLLQAVREDRMPPPGEALQLTDADRENIERGIPVLCELSQSTGRTFFCRDVPYYPGCAVANVESLLGGHCGRCHGATPAFESVPLGNAHVDSARSLLENGYLVACDADASPIVQALRAGPVLPHDRCVRFPEPYDAERVERFVAGLCDVPDHDAAARQAGEILAERCGACHGADEAARPPGHAWDVTDLGGLVRDGVVQPCSVERSALLSSIRDGRMPPAGAGPAPTESELESLERFVDGFCARPGEAGAR